MASKLNRTTLKGTIKKVLANYVEWVTGKGYRDIDAAADKIVALLPGEVPKDVGKVLTEAIHLGVKLNYPIEKFGQYLAKKIRNSGTNQEHSNSDTKIKEKEGEDIMGKRKFDNNINKKKNFKEKQGENDLSWVSNYPELLKGILGPNFFRKKGIPELPISTSAKAESIGSVASIELLLTNGQTVGDGYKLAVDKLYSSLRSANTGASTYTKLDLQYYMWNARMILSMVRYARRAYGVIRKFSLTDKALPQAYFKAMGLDYDSFAANAANIRQEINYLSTRLHTTLPYKDDTMERTCWLFDHIFADSNDVKAQNYLFSLNSRILYWDHANSAWAALSNVTGYANNATTTGTSAANFLAALKTLIDATTNTDIAGFIAADMLKCFGTSTVKYYELIDENYEVPVVYSEEVLTEIQNATLIGEVVHSSTAVQSGDVLIDTTSGYIVSEIVNPYTQVGIASIKDVPNYMNTYKDGLNNAEVVTFTRLQCLGIQDPGYSNKMNWNVRGTETATVIRFVCVDQGSGFKYDLHMYWANKFMYANLLNSTSISELFRIITLWSQFDWAPLIGWALAEYGTAMQPLDMYDLGYLWDFNDYAQVDKEQLGSYHDIAIMSQYNAPLYIRDIRLNAIA